MKIDVMQDLKTAQEALDRYVCSLALVRGGQVLYTSTGKGIAPLLNLISERRDLKGATLSDQVVGLAVAAIAREHGILAVFGKVMSMPARAYLEHEGVIFDYGTLVESIKTADGTATCPIEQIAIETPDVPAMIRRIQEFRDRAVRK
ncbi:MAG: DUF1893 domain-containing protein [Bacillota bacterium]